VDQSIELRAKTSLAQEEIKRLWAIIKPPKVSLVLDSYGTPILGFPNISLKWHPDEPLFPKAFEIANETGRSLYDCLYLSLAVSLDAQMVTADLRFYNALKDGDYRAKLLWIEDIP